MRIGLQSESSKLYYLKQQPSFEQRHHFGLVRRLHYHECNPVRRRPNPTAYYLLTNFATCVDAPLSFLVAFFHAAIPTHWLPFVLAGRGQGWTPAKTLAVTGLAGIGHTVFTAALGVLVVWLGVETSKWAGDVFPFIVGGVLILFGLYYLIR